jgi:hypothetical protein
MALRRTRKYAPNNKGEGNLKIFLVAVGGVVVQILKYFFFGKEKRMLKVPHRWSSLKPGS